MPSAIEYIPPTDNERNIFNTQVTRERRLREQRYRRALRYYKGEHPEQLAYADDEPNDNTHINLVKMTADRTVSFLFSDSPRFLTDRDRVEETPEEEYLKKALNFSGGLNLLHKLGLRGFLSGHNFIRVKPVPEKLKDRDDVFERITSLDPSTITVYWRADDVADVIWYEYRYMVGSVVHITDYINNQDGTWSIVTYEAVGDPLNLWIDTPTHHGKSESYQSVATIDFERSNFKLKNKENHTSLIPPIIEAPHLPDPDDYYGLGEVTQEDLQNTINRITSERSRIVRENSDPVDVLIGVDAREIEGDGGFFSIPNKDAKLQRLEMRGDLSGISTTLDKLVETYLAIARVVLLKGEAKDLQRVTNASVRTLFLDAIAKNKVLRQNYGEALARVAKLILQLAFMRGKLDTNPVTLDVNVEFAEPLPRDESEIANVNAIGIAGGWMSKRTASTRIGGRWDVESKQIQAEAEMMPDEEETDENEDSVDNEEEM